MYGSAYNAEKIGVSSGSIDMLINGKIITKNERLMECVYWEADEILHMRSDRSHNAGKNKILKGPVQQGT